MIIIKLCEFLGEIVTEGFAEVVEWLKNNLYNIAVIINVLCPYITSYAVVNAYMIRCHFAVGSEWLIPIVCWFLIACLKRIANKAGKGVTVPTPYKRFTEKSDDGEITIRMERSEELVLYVCELEDWLEKKGMM